MHSEFGFLKNLKDHFNLPKLGDDCAVIPKDENDDYLITSDMLVEDIDFRLEWTNPVFLGHKALAVSLSDIAAMGGIPLFSMLSIGIPERLWSSGFLDDFYKGYQNYAGRVNVELIGGDISRTEAGLAIDSTVIGRCPKGKAIKRSGAKPGDLIFVTGTVGGAASGLRLLESGLREGSETELTKNKLIKQQLRPFAVDGKFLTDLATSAIDISDGLVSDLFHICNASGAGANLKRSKIPIDSNISSLGLELDQVFECALYGGEDYQLLFTTDAEIFSEHPGFPFQPIGEITDNVGNITLTADGASVKLEPKGFTHF